MNWGGVETPTGGGKKEKKKEYDERKGFGKRM